MTQVQTTTDRGAPGVVAEAARRRTFAIISHPDAGKTTLTEKLLLYSGVIHAAGAVKARAGGAASVSDWMELERERGISVSSAVLQFAYRDCVVNLLDTPGHRDFSEDTYRVLTAVDAAVMVLDSSKGIEAQTLKLFEVCRARRIPVITFLNKQDRPGLEPLELVDDVQRTLGLRAVPWLWPVGPAGHLHGLLERSTGRLVRTERTVHNATVSAEEHLGPDEAEALCGDDWQQALDECELVDLADGGWDEAAFRAGDLTPVLAGAALTNVGVRQLLDTLVDLAPPPAPRPDQAGEPRPLDAPVAGYVFKVQANLDRNHRDQVAFVRICSGRFERGMPLVHEPTGRTVTTRHAVTVMGSHRETTEAAYPGDIVALVNARLARIGDTLHAADGAVRFAGMPRFAPEVFATARPLDLSRAKQFRAGLTQLDAEGVVQVLERLDGASPMPLVAAVGRLQLDVLAHRLGGEFGAEVELGGTPYVAARETDAASAERLAGFGGIEIARRSDGALLALFESEYRLQRLERDHPELTLTRIAATTD